MPGICGVIGKIADGKNRPAIQAMVKSMMHEPFYGSGTYSNEQLGLWAGWVNHKGSFSDCMPVWNETKDACLIFSGENFADESEIDHLKAKGHQLNSEAAGYLVHLYEEMGMRFLEKLNGWFSGVLVDLRDRNIVLFNDRYGLGRIYYHENTDGVYFSSEAKSLLKILPDLRQIDTTSLGELFSCGCTLENRTIFRGISLVPGGSMWTFHPYEQTRKEGYFRSDAWEDQPRLSGKEYYEKLRELFPRILSRYFRGRQRIGVSLTGGIDTRLIMAWAPCPPFKVPCYTFGGMHRDSADVRIGRTVARVCQQRHETIRLNQKFFSEFPALAKRTIYYTDGTMDVSGSVELFVNRVAREIAPIRLTGNYGDQVLRGVSGFKPNSLYEGIFDAEFMQRVRAGATTYSGLSDQNHFLSSWAFKQLPWNHYARHALERTQVTPRSPYLDNELVALAYQAPPEFDTNLGASLHLIAEGDPALSRIATDRGVLLRHVPIVSQIRRICQEFTIKAEYVYDYGMPPWVARLDHFFARLKLENIFLGRHKFYHFRVWYRDELSQYMKDVLLDPRTRNRPYLRGSFLEEMVNSHIKGNRNYTSEIHRILTTELIQRQLVEQS